MKRGSDPARSEAKFRGRAIPSQRIPSPEGAAAHLVPQSRSEKYLSHTLARNPSAPNSGSFSKGRPSRENRDGDCGDTNASQARTNPRFRPYAFGALFPSRFADSGLFFGRKRPPGCRRENGLLSRLSRLSRLRLVAVWFEPDPE
jgi:hypothetical protein